MYSIEDLLKTLLYVENWYEIDKSLTIDKLIKLIKDDIIKLLLEMKHANKNKGE